jgi:hypothetical protein
MRNGDDGVIYTSGSIEMPVKIQINDDYMRIEKGIRAIIGARDGELVVITSLSLLSGV